MCSNVFVRVAAGLVILLVAGAGNQGITGAVPAPATTLLYQPSIAELSVPFRENPKILLGNFVRKSVVLNLLNGQSSASNYLVHLARQAGNSDAGSFAVEAPEDHGVMAVIQRLHLRRISDKSSLLQLVNNCKDYILFEGENGEKTIPICGNLKRGDNSFYPPDLHGPKFFNSPSGRIKVTFRNLFDYGNELVAENDTDVHEDNKEVLTVEISFTAYSKCLTRAEAAGKFQCTVGQCIDERLVCDDVVNCTPGENQRQFGVDEKNCTSNLPPMDTEEPAAVHHGQGHGRSSEVIIDEDIIPFEIDPHLHHNNNHHENHDSPKPPPMTTIIILVIILAFVTVCGYFWSWLSHVCCILRGIFRSAEVGVEMSQQQSSPNQVFTGAPARFSVAYYVPAVVLRATSSTSPGSISNSSSIDVSKTRVDDSESPPPPYEMLFPSKS